MNKEIKSDLFIIFNVIMELVFLGLFVFYFITESYSHANTFLILAAVIRLERK